MDFKIDKTRGLIIVNNKSITFDQFLNDKSQVGRSAYEDWLRLPGNAGKSIYEFIEFLKGTDGVNGEDAYNVYVDSDRGTVFKNGDGEELTLTCYVSKGGAILADSDLARFAFIWRREGLEVLLNDFNQVVGSYSGGTVPYGYHLSRNITNASKAKYIKIGAEDVTNKANFSCDVLDR